MRSHCLMLACGIVLSVPAAQSAWTQEGRFAPVKQMETPQSSPDPEGELWKQAPVLSVTTREVVVDLVATDHHDHPIFDLSQADISVFEIGQHGHKSSQHVTSLRLIRPTLGSDANDLKPASGLHVSLGGGCAERSTAHYQISYGVSSDFRQSGYHQILVLSHRRDVQLAYTPRYFVGSTGVDAAGALKNQQAGLKAAEIDSLEEAACYHTTVPLSIPLTAYLVHTASSSDTVYEVAADKGSLPLLSLSANDRRVSLAYAACTFDENGRPVKVFSAELDRTLSLREYAQATLHGLPSRMDVSGERSPAFVRFVLRNRLNGNIGSVLVRASAPLPKGELTPAEKHADLLYELERLRQFGIRRNLFPPMGPEGSFGSVEPRPEALCGDVYELPTSTSFLPNFWNLASVGSVYADVLNVPHQQFWATGGVPGVTRKTDWFGVDYHGVFWVHIPGKYRFDVIADDGAKLYVDDVLVIDADGEHTFIERDGTVNLSEGLHTLHLPYFQGPENAVALQLLIARPGGELTPFDVRDYGPPSSNPAEAEASHQTR